MLLDPIFVSVFVGLFFGRLKLRWRVLLLETLTANLFELLRGWPVGPRQVVSVQQRLPLIVQDGLLAFNESSFFNLPFELK